MKAAKKSKSKSIQRLQKEAEAIQVTEPMRNAQTYQYIQGASPLPAGYLKRCKKLGVGAIWQAVLRPALGELDRQGNRATRPQQQLAGAIRAGKRRGISCKPVNQKRHLKQAKLTTLA